MTMTTILPLLLVPLSRPFHGHSNNQDNHRHRKRRGRVFRGMEEVARPAALYILAQNCRRLRVHPLRAPRPVQVHVCEPQKVACKKKLQF